MATNPNTEQNRYETRQPPRSHRLGLTGPVLLITLGAMFLLGQFVPEWGVGKTWPVILIVIGLTRMLESVSAGRQAPPQ